MYIRVKTFKGHPFCTLFWAVLTVFGTLGGVSGAMGIYYLIFPSSGMQQDMVTLFAIAGIPVAIVSFILRAMVEKKARGKMETEQVGNSWERTDTD